MDDRAGAELDVGEAAELLGVRPREVYELIDGGQLAAYKVGKRIRLRSVDVEAYRTGHPAA
jgi:excisionase family DNA binding protein